jgi:hypothetical protein
MRRCLEICAGLMLLSALGRPLSAEVHRYYCSLSLRSGEVERRCEMPKDGTIDGGYDVVTTDDQNRPVRVAWYWGTQKKSETRYIYREGAKFYDSTEHYSAGGELTSRVVIQRNATGEQTRVEVHSPTGEVTSWTVRAISGDQVDEVSYHADGSWAGHNHYFYSPAGILIRSRYYPQQSDAVYYESEIDTNNGNETLEKKFENGVAQITTKYTYTVYGDKTREDLYDPNGNWYASRDFSAWLLTDEKYKFHDGSTQESKRTYDSNRLLTSSTFYRNDQLICTFTYDHLSTGAIKRTLALAGDGTLMAEYDDLAVDKVDRTGHPIDHPTGGKIHKTGNWW